MRKLVTSANTLLTPYIHLLPISKMPNLDTLTDSQKNELIEQYVDIVVDNMDVKSMIQYITDDLRCHFESVSLNELKDEVDNHDEELYDELVDNVTQQYAKLPNTFGGQS